MTKLFRIFVAMISLTLLSACGGGGGSAGNTSGNPLYTTAPQRVTILPGASQTYQIGGGVPNYSATSSSAAATVAVSGKNLVITGATGGLSNVTVTDASGSKVLIEVTVGTGVDFFTSAPDRLSLTIGQVSAVFQMGGGSGIYRVNTGNPQVANVTQNGASFYITGVSAGSTTVVATDSLGATRTINVTIGTGIDLFTSAPSSIVVAVGTSSAVYTIGGGSQVYSISSSNQSIATVGLSNRNQFIVTGRAGGTATVVVKDSLGASVTINVVVGSSVALFTSAAPNTKLEVGGSGIFKVGGGTTSYSVASSNSAVATAVLNGDDLTITGVAVGLSTVTVVDTAGASVAISVTVGSGTPPALFTTAGTDLVVATGTTPTFTVGGGRAPYAVTSSNTATIGAKISGATLTITGIAEGSGRVTVSDADGTKVLINVTVGTGVAIPLFTTAPSDITVAPAATATYTVGGGTAPYTFTSSNTAVASVSGSGKTFSVSGVINGDATILVRDSAGASVSINVTISAGPQIALFTTAPASITIGVGAPATYSIGGGRAPYSVTSGNTTAATVSLGTNAFTVTGVSAGSGSISIRDSVGAIVSVNFVVASGPNVPLFTTAPPSIVSATGVVSTYTAGGGTGPYTVTSSNTAVASVPSGTFASSFTITGGVSGTTTVIVRDSVGASVSISYTVSNGTTVPMFTTAPASLAIGVGGSALTYTITGGSAPYTVTASNPVVVTTTTPTASTFTILGNQVGSSNVIVRDSLGATVTVAVTVGTSVPLFTTSPASITIAAAGTVNYVASGGTAPYTISSSNTAIATVSPSSGTFASAFSISGAAAGSAQVVVRDAVGATVSIAVTVSPSAVVPIDVLPGDATGAVGDNLTFVVTGGSGSYTISNNNPSIASVSPTSIGSSGGTFTASLLNAGSTTISITDSQGQVKRITVTANVAGSTMRISPSAIEIGEDNTSAFTLNIKGGTGPYRVFTSDLVKSGVAVSGNIITVSVGTQGSRCIHPVDLSVPPVYQRGSTYTVTITALDSLGTSATSTMAIRDNSRGAGATNNCGD